MVPARVSQLIFSCPECDERTAIAIEWTMYIDQLPDGRIRLWYAQPRLSWWLAIRALVTPPPSALSGVVLADYDAELKLEPPTRLRASLDRQTLTTITPVVEVTAAGDRQALFTLDQSLRQVADSLRAGPRRS